VDVVPLTVEYYATKDGRIPFEDWLQSLDRSILRRVANRLERLRRGLLGDSEHFGGGLWELRIDTGPGYRIYAGRAGNTLVILLQGGDKRSQDSDIQKARDFWGDYLRRTHE
jgi:putative addiction module killer protein